MIERLLSSYQHALPQHTLSRLMGFLARSEWAPWKEPFIRWFIRHYDVDMTEALDPNPETYSSFNAFFTRALRPDARPLAADPGNLVCPVDGRVSQLGTIDSGQLLQAKGRCFALSELLGGESGRENAFQDGRFATLYLSPRDYHRVHMPVDGDLRSMRHIPGRLFSVSPLTTRGVDRLFARNERVVTFWDTAQGPMAMVLVGAIFVASIETVWAGTITPPRGHWVREWRYEPGQVALAKGAEMGRFQMGSTVIILFGPDTIAWDAAIGAGTRVQMGQALARPS